MVAFLGFAGVLAYGLVSLAVGVRLVWLARRTRGVPELAIGAGFLVGVILGYGPETVATATDWVDVETRRWLLAASQVTVRLAAISVLFFTWRVFRPTERWAAALFCGTVVVLAASWLGFPLSHRYAASPEDLAWSRLYQVARIGCLAWGAAEAGLHYARARRRLHIGLGDALTTERFALWSLGLATSALLMGSPLWAALLGVSSSSPLWTLGESLLGLVTAIAMWLTFFPPAFYRERARARTAACAVA